jgi:purine-binding chemotaxis protein CheW
MNQHDAEKHFVFVHQQLQYALPVRDVLEIVEAPALLPPHGEMAGYLGNVSHRRHLFPVLDPTALGTSRPLTRSAGRSVTFVIVRYGDTVFGLALDRFVAVVSLEAPTAADASRPPDNPFVEQVRSFRDNALLLLASEVLAGHVQRHFRVQQQQLTDGEGIPAPPQRSRTEMPRIFLCARLDRMHFAIAVEQVSEVIEGYDVTPLFKMPPLVRGLINLRGQVLACLDLSGELGFAPRVLEERNQFVVLHHEGAALALCVDRVTGIRRLLPEQFQKADLVLSGEMTRYCTGILEADDGALFGLAVPALFEAPALLPYRRQEA